MPISEEAKIILALVLTLSLFAFFGYLPSLLFLGRGLYKKFLEKQE